MNNIINEIEKEIQKFQNKNIPMNFGYIISLADGIAIVSGLSNVMFNEVIIFENNIYGIALNLDENFVGCIVLGDIYLLKEGDKVFTTGKLLSIPVGKELLGRVINPLGEPIDGKGLINSKENYNIERESPSILDRYPVKKPLETGIMSIDSMIPIGRGQRELIIGDRSTGKTNIALSTIINQAKINDKYLSENLINFRPVYSIYVSIGQKNSDLARIIKTLEEYNALKYTVIVSASSSDNSSLQYISPYSGTAIGEWFMYNGMDALIVYDDLSKHAIAYRQISLILKRPSSREAYPGDIFYLHSKLLERSAQLNNKCGSGSLSALPIVETQLGDVSAYIPTNIISITDGQIFLETNLFNQGIRPAVSIGLSVSRVGSAAQIKALKQISSKIKLEIAQYRELEAFSQFSSDLDKSTQNQIEKGKRIIEILKQDSLYLISTEIQVCLLWALQNKFLDKISINKIKAACLNLEQFLLKKHFELLKLILNNEYIDNFIINKLKIILESWEKEYKHNYNERITRN